MKPKILVTRAIFPDVVERLATHFEVESNQDDRVLSAAELQQKVVGKAGLLATASESIGAQLIGAGAQAGLKAICNMAVGYNNIDLAAATRAGVLVTNTPDVLNQTTADFGWALLMAAARRVTEAEHWLRAGHWKKWRYDTLLGADVHGSTLGIIGMGRIGQAIARRSLGFDMRVLYHNRSRLAPELEARCNHAQYVSKEQLLREADHVMLVLPYSPESHHTIGAAELALMKPGATLVNIARGGIVDDAALIAALRATPNRGGRAGRVRARTGAQSGFPEPVERGADAAYRQRIRADPARDGQLRRRQPDCRPRRRRAAEPVEPASLARSLIVPDISIRQAHKLSHKKAHAAAQKVVDQLVEEYELAIQWEGNVLFFKRSGVSGTLALHEKEVHLEITLGFLLKAFAPKISAQVEKNMKKVFGGKA